MSKPEGWKLVLQELLESQEKHYGQMAALALAGSRLHAGEADMTEGVIKGIEYCIEALEALAAAPTPPTGTPSAQWRENEETDPHGERYKCERAELCMGNLTDDELANAVFLHGNESPDIAAVLRGEAHMPLLYLTAAKDRIRWLSRKLEEFSSETPPAPEVEPVTYRYR